MLFTLYSLILLYTYNLIQGLQILRDLNTHSNPTLKFYNEELFIYKCCYILYIFYKQFFKQI